MVNNWENGVKSKGNWFLIELAGDFESTGFKSVGFYCIIILPEKIWDQDALQEIKIQSHSDL